MEVLLGKMEAERRGLPLARETVAQIKAIRESGVAPDGLDMGWRDSQRTNSAIIKRKREGFFHKVIMEVDAGGCPVLRDYQREVSRVSSGLSQIV